MWNVHKLDDPQAAKWQENARGRGYGGGGYAGDWQFQQEVVVPCEAQFRAVAEKLNLKDGSYTMLVRVPAGGSHQFRILEFMVRHDQWNPATMRNDAVRVSLEKYIGLVEIVEARDGDEKVPMYDPLRVHGVNSIQGTMMAQRVHAAMAEHRVHQFWKLPENVRVHLREQVEAYSDQRFMNRLENERLHQYAPTRDEVTLPADALQECMHAYDQVRVHKINRIGDRVHQLNPDHEYTATYGAAYGERLHALAQSKAAKLSAELKDRFAVDRALRMRTHGDDLTVNPSQHMQARVHNLFDRERAHTRQGIMNSLTPREKEFYGDNKPGGYVDTVESAIHGQRVPFDPRSVPARVHYEGVHGARLHAERLHGGNHRVAVSGPVAQYGNISDALDDYDLGGNGYEEVEVGRGAFFGNAAEESKHDD